MSQERHYCYTCGAECKVRMITYEYNERTGKAKQFEQPHCPNNRWWKLGHYERLVDSLGTI